MANSDKRDIALITGANKGIGWETARQLGDKGMTVLVGARERDRGEDATRRLVALGHDAHFVQLDVTDATSIADAVQRIEADFGRLDVLVNNAGIVLGFEPPSDTRLDAVRAVFEVNVFGMIAVTVACLPLLRKAAQPRIVNVSSGLGSIAQQSDPSWEYGSFGVVAYPTSKAAVDMLTVLFAKELGPQGFKVNAADPGYTATDLNGHRGPQPVEVGAIASVRLATLGPDGPTGGHFDQHGERVPW